VKAHQKGRGPKEFTVGAGDTVRKTGIRIDRSDWPVDYSRDVEFIDKDSGRRLSKDDYKYKVTLGYELILSCDKVDGTFKVRVLSSLPLEDLEKRDAAYLEMLKTVGEKGLDFMAVSDTADEDAQLPSDYD